MLRSGQGDKMIRILILLVFSFFLLFPDNIAFGTTWSIETVETSANSRGAPSLAFDSNNNPAIAYTKAPGGVFACREFIPNYAAH